jgi:hypothetical protein
MKTVAFFLSIGATVLAGCSDAPDSSEAKQPPGAPDVPGALERAAEHTQVIAYYFHGTLRCETCQKIERQAREALERRFPLELIEKRLVFKPVNYDKPENAHFLKDYRLPCPSLVVVRRKGATDEKWELLGETWEHVENPAKFKEYIVGEVEKLLRGVK